MKKLFLLLMTVILTTTCAFAQAGLIKGTVVSASDNEPLPGATVMAPDGQGVATNLNGEFQIRVAEGTLLKVSYVGHTTQTVKATDGIVVKLIEDNQLNEVVVTGYGSAKKLGSMVGSVSVVGEQVLAQTPSSNFVDALQGQVAGLSIFSNSGEPSAVPDAIRVRGVNSLTASTTPLFILDGAPVTSTVFTSINPSDIESVTVLKDAASTSIYGSRAANGVIVITTKKGNYGDKARVTVRASVGISDMARYGVDLMNSEQYIQFRDKINMPVSQEVRDVVSKYGISTDWRDELIKDNALTYKLEARIQGGSDKTRYYLSLGDYSQDGLIAKSGITRQTLSTNLDTKVNDWLQVGLSGQFGYETYETNGNAEGRYAANAFAASESLLPYDAPYYYLINDDGKLEKLGTADYYRYSQKLNPNWMSENMSNGTKTQVNAMMNLYEQLTPVKGLTVRAQQAMTAFDYRYTYLRDPLFNFTTPMGDTTTSLGSYGKGEHSESFQRWYRFTYTNTAEYKFDVNKLHYFTFLLGQESVIEKSSQFGVTTSGQPSSSYWLLNQGTDVAINNVSQSISKSVINSYFFNVNYEYDDRYFVDLSVRRDGSSKFAPGHRWGTFYAVGAMWNVKAESFLSPVTWLDVLKIRLNYGTTGNSGINNYAYQGIVSSGRLYNGQNSLAIASQANHDLTWETVKQLNFGFDFRIFNHLSGTFDVYKKNTDNMLLDIPYDYTTGFAEGSANIGSLSNTGFEFELNYDIYSSKDWYVGVKANVAYNDLKITELFNGLDKFTIAGTGVTYRVGHNPYTINVVQYAGVDPRDGQQMWYDLDGNLTKTYNEENEVDTGKSFVSPWNGGWGLAARYKGLSLSADFSWAGQKYIFDGNYWYTRTADVCASQNGSPELLNVWTKPGDVTDIPNLFDAYGQAQSVEADSRFVDNTSYMRLKNLTINYSLPTKWMKAVKLEAVNVHFTGRNLLTFTSFDGVDPEYEGNVVQFSYPNTRQFEFGIDVTF